MGIELNNPETVLGKVDAAANYVGQLRIALMVGDPAKVQQCISEIERHLFNATRQLEE